MEKLKILFASPEVVPFIKTGGLADVAGMLPRVLAAAGHSVKVALPHYSAIAPAQLRNAVSDLTFELEIDGQPQSLTLNRIASDYNGLEYLLIRNDHFFDRKALYIDPATGLDYADNDSRFIFFCRGLMESLKRTCWAPDIIHANDWQTALLPTYLATAYGNDPFFSKTRSVYTIHNLAYQGTFPANSFSRLGLDENLFHPMGPFEFYHKVNFMKSAINYATVISTVSERYAVEIQSSDEYGCGLEGVLRGRNEDLFGIVNGVDYNEWSPSKDEFIPFK